MPKLIFVNLPVTDLARSVAFYEAVGGAVNPQFTDETAACIVLSDVIHVMLLTHDKWRQFTAKPIVDAHAAAQVLLALSEESRQAVDARVAAAVQAGGAPDPTPLQQHGEFMYGRSYQDPDGHIWEVMWMDLGDAPAASAAEPAEVERGLTPHLVCDGAAEAIDFYRRAFGAEELMRLPAPDGKLMHAAVMINGHMVMLVDEGCGPGAVGPRTLGGTPVTVHLNLPDVDHAVARAVAAGAEVVMPVADQFWGDRFGLIRDPFGHEWSLATPLRAPMTAHELTEAAQGATA